METLSIIEFCKKFYDKPGPIYVDTHIEAHIEGIIASRESDIWPVGKEGRNITFTDISAFFKKVFDKVDKTHETFVFEGIKFTQGKYKAQLLFGT